MAGSIRVPRPRGQRKASISRRLRQSAYAAHDVSELPLLERDGFEFLVESSLPLTRPWKTAAATFSGLRFFQSRHHVTQHVVGSFELS